MIRKRWIESGKYMRLYKKTHEELIDAIATGALTSKINPDDRLVYIWHDYKSVLFITGKHERKYTMERSKFLFSNNGFDIYYYYDDKGWLNYKGVGKVTKAVYYANNLEELINVVESDKSEVKKAHSLRGSPVMVYLSYTDLEYLYSIVSDSKVYDKLRVKLEKAIKKSSETINIKHKEKREKLLCKKLK